MKLDKRLREINMGEMEGSPMDVIMDIHSEKGEAMRNWQYPEGECWKDVN